MYSEPERVYAAHNRSCGAGPYRSDTGRNWRGAGAIDGAGQPASADITGRNGIRWTIASDLLAQGEREVLLDYVTMVRAVSNKSQFQLDAWAKSIGAGEISNFSGTAYDHSPRFVVKLAPDLRLRSLDPGSARRKRAGEIAVPPDRVPQPSGDRQT